MVWTENGLIIYIRRTALIALLYEVLLIFILTLVWILDEIPTLHVRNSYYIIGYFFIMYRFQGM